MGFAASNLQEATNVLVLLSTRQRLRLSSCTESLLVEVAHVGAVLVLLAQVFSVERLVLLLSEHLSLVIAFELFLAFMMLGILLTVIVDLLAVLVWIHVSVKTSKEIRCANRL